MIPGTGDKDLFELELVQVVIRHGDRAPIHSMPNYQLPHIPCIAHPDLLEVAPFYEEFTTRLSKPAVSTVRKVLTYGSGDHAPPYRPKSPE